MPRIYFRKIAWVLCLDPYGHYTRFLDRARGLGTLPPALRASESPIAMACLRLVTFLPERPLLSCPRFISCIARFTFSCAFLPYFAIPSLHYLLMSSFFVHLNVEAVKKSYGLSPNATGSMLLSRPTSPREADMTLRLLLVLFVSFVSTA